MRVLSDSEMLAIWERGGLEGGVARAVLLAAESTGGSEADSADLCIGQRNAAILRLLDRNFGSRLDGCVDCPRCAERLEFGFDCGAALAQMRAPETGEFTAGQFR